VAFVIAVLGVGIGMAAGLLGAGPSILTVLLLRHVAGLDIGRAIVTSLVVVACMSLVAVVPFVATRAIAWRCAAFFGLASVTGAFVAGRLSVGIPERALMVAFLLAMILAAVAMFQRRATTEGDSCRRPTSMIVGLLLGGGLVGSVTGLVGLGGGFAVVPILVLFAQTPVRAAIGTSILLIAVNTSAAFASHLPHPQVDWTLAAYLGPSECVGSLLGVAIAKHLSAEVLRRAFASVMLVAAVVMLANEIHG
jgi:uncharacterized protein